LIAIILKLINFKYPNWMKTNTAQTINKKLILHFDVENVIQLPTQVDKDFYVIMLIIKGI